MKLTPLTKPANTKPTGPGADTGFSREGGGRKNGLGNKAKRPRFQGEPCPPPMNSVSGLLKFVFGRITCFIKEEVDRYFKSNYFVFNSIFILVHIKIS